MRGERAPPAARCPLPAVRRPPRPVRGRCGASCTPPPRSAGRRPRRAGQSGGAGGRRGDGAEAAQGSGCPRRARRLSASACPWACAGPQRGVGGRRMRVGCVGRGLVRPHSPTPLAHSPFRLMTVGCTLVTPCAQLGLMYLHVAWAGMGRQARGEGGGAAAAAGTPRYPLAPSLLHSPGDAGPRGGAILSGGAGHQGCEDHEAHHFWRVWWCGGGGLQDCGGEGAACHLRNSRRRRRRHFRARAPSFTPTSPSISRHPPARAPPHRPKSILYIHPHPPSAARAPPLLPPHSAVPTSRANGGAGACRALPHARCAVHTPHARDAGLHPRHAVPLQDQPVPQRVRPRQQGEFGQRARMRRWGGAPGPPSRPPRAPRSSRNSERCGDAACMDRRAAPTCAGWRAARG
jgi:hypothetical protein